MGAPEIKYTDRDVRETPELIGNAISYLRQYEGEFQFLIDCKQRLAMGESLPTPLIRGVLNCMRVDPRVVGLPAPIPPQEAKVIDIRKERQNPNLWGPSECEITEFHDRHSIGDEDEFRYRHTCSGIYELNREPFEMPAQINVPFFAGRTGALIHKVNTDPERTTAWFMWRPFAHEYDYYKDPDLYVRTECKFPRFIQNPVLIPEPMMHQALNDPVFPRADPRVLCPRCFPDDRLHSISSR